VNCLVLASGTAGASKDMETLKTYFFFKNKNNETEGWGCSLVL
jgi:hypothetical protein